MRDSLELFDAADVSLRDSTGPLAGRRFLLVTLPFGPFARRLGGVLRGMGAEVFRVALNGGDLIDWGFSNVVIARCALEDWPRFVAEAIADRRITDVVTLGDEDAYCLAAIAAARAAGVRALVMENGYHRPDWVTVELGGVNANSPMPRDPSAYDDVELDPLGETPPPVGAIMPHKVAHTFAHFTATILAWPFFPRFVYQCPLGIWPQAFGYVRRFFALLGRRGERKRESLAILDDPNPFFLACLQREADSQILRHSEVKTNREFMAKVFCSFAAHAPANARLVFKNHPLDPGIDNLARACQFLAEAHGVADRVTFLEGGAFVVLAQAAAGVVAVNSTAALAAMGVGTPVKLLGRALFAIDGLDDRQPMDSFWRAPRAPDAQLFARFSRRLTLRTQVHGSFCNPQFLTRTAQGVAARFAYPGAEFMA